MFEGVGYAGSSAIQTSTANQEVIPNAPTTWNQGYRFYKFAFMNQADCTVVINGGDPIFLGANQGFSTDKYDQAITSFVIVEAGINFNWIGAY